MEGKEERNERRGLFEKKKKKDLTKKNFCLEMKNTFVKWKWLMISLNSKLHTVGEGISDLEIGFEEIALMKDKLIEILKVKLKGNS